QILASDPRKIKLMRSKILKSMELEETKRKFHAMEEEIQRGEKAEIVVTKGVYPGVKVTIGQNHLAIKDAVADVTLRSRKGENGVNIGIFSNE
ncbi:MAG: FapA family protein, partial [Lachnospiraceae bacterium]|nr:FapA family protein [Lachnospiraceae bacterium]